MRSRLGNGRVRGDEATGSWEKVKFDFRRERAGEISFEYM